MYKTEAQAFHAAGARHFPELEASRRQEMIDGRRERAERFEMKSGGEMYRDFPGMVRASTPLYIKSAGAQVISPSS